MDLAIPVEVWKRIFLIGFLNDGLKSENATALEHHFRKLDLVSRYCSSIVRELVQETFSHLPNHSDWILQHFSNVTHLKLLDNFYFKSSITDNGLSTCTNLLSLECNSERITDTGLLNLTKLEVLILSNNPNITDNSLTRLVHLKYLVLDGSKITSEGIKNLTNLNRLSLSRHEGVGGAALLKLTNLKCLLIRENKTVKDDDIKHLTNLEELK